MICIHGLHSCDSTGIEFRDGPSFPVLSKLQGDGDGCCVGNFAKCGKNRKL